MAVSSPLSSRQTVAALLTLTAVTGLVDAVSYLRLGRVFVANMTGNVVFLGFSVYPHSGLSAIASLVAIGGFLLGALLGGAAATRLERPSASLARHRGRRRDVARRRCRSPSPASSRSRRCPSQPLR